MQSPAHVFREYDIRGVADRDLTDELAFSLGLGLASTLAAGRSPRLAVGRDCRLSSGRLHEALLRGLVEGGAHVVDVGVGPTPMLYFAVHHLETDGGIMITGSHNPADENGFKIMRGRASFFGADIQQLRARLDAGDLPRTPGGKVESIDVQDDYVATTTSRIARPKEPMKVVLDAGNGVGGPLGLRCLRTIGLEPDPLFCDMDGLFPNHHPDPTVPKNMAALIERVVSTGARVGLAYDGDADRLGAVDANGDIVWGDKLMILFSRALLETNPGAKILGEVKCSSTLYDDIARHGGQPIMWKTGHSLIKTKMKQEGALLAGEMSGHLFFADRYFGYDDAIYASMRLVELLAASGKTMGELLADVPRTFTTPELRVDCPDATKFDIVAGVAKTFRGRGRHVIDVDGARIEFPSGWGLVRASNTGPVLVMRFEAQSEAELAKIRGEVEAAVQSERQQRP
ncbi:MAG TPA: phosphomannomutase/phosphoglucomutase [Polyangiaceae bacterium]|nr:phosphomannomutase/phosphoglucomutase [Polyangiaceae bacterium]